MNIADVIYGLDNRVDLNDNEAYTLAREACQEIMDSAASNGMFSVIDYMNLITQQAKGFSYQKITGEAYCNEDTKQLLSIVWMIATMRPDYKLFGNHVSFDMTKRNITTLG